MGMNLSQKDKNGKPYKKRKWRSSTRGLDSAIHPKTAIIKDAFEFRSKDISEKTYLKLSKTFQKD